ncbi:MULTISPECIES: flagellar assembly peptidoglycan hydrolase FlgJ [Halomonadaceae]|uniref:Peptidoglycan hydrolase FlgJ n=1 Tax=Halomonas johnsoniae TaxID=502832 RepID=A0ABQ2WT87_9GAMM|nr:MULTISPECIES: flagellar assembly peptidoglycan hydrolase FlgJ [Halomonas]ATH76976.1 flagellar assembly peptidoglycan hydrolase FlgJ [Halomonas hydrothermalis]KHJ50707.1 mannosyl-glycoprotein endo-beta-N-acetylglucosamidase [Halomonas hydrothermalis]GGW70025.1 flagellar rod assembly protein/muramidase FlgJ [Halomonas johnsoniae]
MSMGDMTSQFALDMNGFQRLQHNARVDPEAGVQGAAQQFEALFIQMMVKSMRDATPTSGLMNSRDMSFYQSMMDQQWSQVMASRGIGLADALIDQLQRQGAIGQASDADQELQALIAGIPRGTPRVLDNPLQPPEAWRDDNTGNGRFYHELDIVRQRESRQVESQAATPRAAHPHEHVERFMNTLAMPAKAASAATGVPAELILAQAALETGWGRHEIATQQGRNSFNVFGIKAGSHWQGNTTNIVTHEYINGRRTQVVDAFRVYDSFEHAFTDYARLIGNNPRYAGVVQAGSPEQAAHALQRGGYATDPRYAEKLIAVMNTMGPLGTSSNLLADAR